MIKTARVRKGKWKAPKGAAPELPYEIIEIEDEGESFEYLLEQCRVMKVCAVDTETNSNLKPDKKKGEMYFDWAQGARAFMATFCASDDTVFAAYDSKIVKNVLLEIDALDTKQVYQNLKFDLHHLREWANYIPSTLEHPIDDTMFGFRLRFPRQKAALKTASARYVKNFDTEYYQKEVHEWLAREKGIRDEGTFWFNGKKPSFADVPKDIMLPYATGDAWLTLKSWYGLRDDRAFESQLYKDEVLLMQLLVMVERAGWRVRKEKLIENIQMAKEMYEKYASDLNLMAPGLNVFSDTMLKKLFYDTLGEQVVFHTEKGEPSTSETALHRFTKNTPLRDLVLNVRKWKKSHNTHVALEYYSGGDGCIHSVLKSEEAITGRFGSEHPNTQNWDSFYENKPWTGARDCLGPEDGFVHLFADYQQIEMVVFADYTNCKSLIDAIKEGKDLHSNTASLMFAVPFDELLENLKNGDPTAKLYRKLGKGMNFTIIFGAGWKKIAGMLQYGDKAGEGAIDLDTVAKIVGPNKPHTYASCAKFLLNAYYSGLPEADEFIKGVRENVKNRSPRPWVKNKFGRVIPIDPGFEYVGVNYLVQSSAADLMKKAMRKSWQTCEQFCKEAGLMPWRDVQLFATIHDDLGFKIKEDVWKDLAPRIKTAMCDWDNFKVPISASFELVKPGSSWARKEKVDV